jgi:hypothetical protein
VDLSTAATTRKTVQDCSCDLIIHQSQAKHTDGEEHEPRPSQAQADLRESSVSSGKRVSSLTSNLGNRRSWLSVALPSDSDEDTDNGEDDLDDEALRY